MKTPVPCFVLILLWLCALQIAHATPALNGALPNASSVPVYGLFELTVGIATQYANPFDPDQIDVGSDFAGPDGRVIHVNGFWMQNYTRSLSGDGREVLTPSRDPLWKIRFAPTTPGVWRYTVTARDASGSTTPPASVLHVTTSTDPGFVGVSKRNPRAFAFPGDRPYFAIGEDMCWPSSKLQTYSYDSWIPKLHAAGGQLDPRVELAPL